MSLENVHEILLELVDIIGDMATSLKECEDALLDKNLTAWKCNKLRYMMLSIDKNINILLEKKRHIHEKWKVVAQSFDKKNINHEQSVMKVNETYNKCMDRLNNCVDASKKGESVTVNKFYARTQHQIDYFTSMYCE